MKREREHDSFVNLPASPGLLQHQSYTIERLLENNTNTGEGNGMAHKREEGRQEETAKLFTCFFPFFAKNCSRH